MNMLEHTRVFTIEEATRDLLEERSDDLADALIDMEEGHPELLDSSIFVDLKEGSIGATITIGHSMTYSEAVAHADSLLVKAIESTGGHLLGQAPPVKGNSLRNVSGPKSLAVA